MSNEEIKKEFEVEDKKPAWEILNEQKEKLLEIIKEKPEILDTQLLKPEIIYPNMERYEMSNGMNNLMLSTVSADKKYADNTWVMAETVNNAKYTDKDGEEKQVFFLKKGEKATKIGVEVKEKNVTFIRLMFSDILGTMKNVEIPATDEQLDKVLSNKAMFDGSSIEGFVRINESDMYLYPDLDTWTVFPWGDENGSVAGLICDVYTTDHVPFLGDPRSNLKRALKHMEELGFKSFNLGPEPEFFLFKLNENGDPTLEVNDKGGYFDLAPTDLADNTRREIVNVLTKMGFEVEASHHEVAVGQHEIDFKYDEVLRACDKIQIFKLVVKTIARKHGLYATFMAKPKFGIAGSGMHCNMSLFDQDGNNAFFDPEDPKGMQLSETAYHFLGGDRKSTV